MQVLCIPGFSSPTDACKDVRDACCLLPTTPVHPPGTLVSSKSLCWLFSQHFSDHPGPKIAATVHMRAVMLTWAPFFFRPPVLHRRSWPQRQRGLQSSYRRSLTLAIYLPMLIRPLSMWGGGHCSWAQRRNTGGSTTFEAQVGDAQILALFFCHNIADPRFFASLASINDPICPSPVMPPEPPIRALEHAITLPLSVPPRKARPTLPHCQNITTKAPRATI